MMTNYYAPPESTKNYEPIEGELWLHAEGFSPNYYVSNMGRLLTTTHHGGKTPAIMKPAMDIDHRRRETKGYYKTVLDGKSRRVHIVVARTWVPNPDNKPCVNHIDGDKTNNKASNLEWVTPSENQKHAYRTGLEKSRIGEQNNMTVLTDWHVRFLRRCWDTGEGRLPRKEFAKLFGVSEATIKDILENKSWRHLPLTKYKWHNGRRYLR